VAKLDGLDCIADALQGLQPKIVAQIAKKILSLGVEPLPHDSAQLIGYTSLRRVDSGEYRIIYRHHAAEDTVEILLIGKRNDDEVYKQLRRKLK